MNNLVSIIIPTFNRAQLIVETLDSIVAQDYVNWECIIVDDGSSDNSEDVITKYAAADRRFKYFKRPANRIKGANSCRNYGFEISNGTYIKWFDSDDIMHPQFLEMQVAKLQANTAIDFCACSSKIFNDSPVNAIENYNSPYLSNERSLYHFVIGKLFFLTPAPLWRRHFLEGKQLFDETLYYAQETDFNFRRLAEGALFEFLDETLFYVRRGHESIEGSSQQDIRSFESQLEYFENVYRYLAQEQRVSLTNKEQLSLLRYALFRKLVIFYIIALHRGGKVNRGDFKKLRQQVCSRFVPRNMRLRLLSGLYLLRYFKKGYKLLYIKEFDLR